MSLRVLHHRLFAEVSRAPERMVLESGVHRYRWREVWQAAGLIAETFRLDLGVQPGDVVALALPRSGLSLVVQLALVRLGVTISLVDPALPAERLGHIWRQLSCKLALVSQGATLPGHDGLRVHPLLVDWLDALLLAPHLGELAGLDDGPFAENTPAYVMFTSGSTGAPKGVMVPAAGIERLARSSDACPLLPGQRWGLLASPSFDASILEMWMPLLNGGVCVVQGNPRPSLADVSAFLLGSRIDACLLTTSLFNALVEDSPEALGTLQHLLVGGEQASAQHIAAALNAWPNLSVVNAYGPTENAVVTLMHRVTPDDLTSPEGIPIGSPLPFDELCIVSDDGDVLAEGPGELWVSGPGVAMGYLNAPEQTAQKFVQRFGRRWYTTGDLVRQRPDGVFLYVGRKDRQVKVQGHRIELDEVELHLSTCPGVSESIVFLEGDTAEQKRLVVVYACQQGASADAEGIQRHLSQFLPPAALPRRHVQWHRMPRTLSGKLDRQAAISMASQGDVGLRLGFWQALRHALLVHADACAVRQGEQFWTYADLDKLSLALARNLTARGVRAGDRLPLMFPRSVDLMVAMLALVRCGVAYVPIDLQSPRERMALILDRLDARCVIVGGGHQADAWLLSRFEVLNLDLADLAQTPADELVAHVDWPDRAETQPLYVMFTSGSTGVPKGVEVSDANLAALLVSPTWADFSPQARWLWATSPAFDISGVEIWGPLLHGACVVVLEGYLPSLDEMARCLVEAKVTHAQLSTALFNVLVDVQLPALAGLAQFITGGERASPQHMRRLLLAHPHVQLINGYGPTETTVYATSHLVQLSDTYRPEGVPIGRAVQANVLRIDEASGELLVGGAGVALGYLKAPDLTDQRFVQLEGQRWYRTGDLVRRLDEGTLAYLGRADRQVKLQGQRIELDDVELTLSNCPGVREVAVLLRGGSAQDKHLQAFYSGPPNERPSEQALAAHAAAHLPLAAVPKVLVGLDSLPVSINGKVDRAALAAWYDVDAAAGARAVALTPSQPAWQTPWESALAGIWQALLPHAMLTSAAHFLTMGGTSILALRVAAEVRRVLSRDLRPVDVLLHPVLADQAAFIAVLPALPPEKPSCDSPVSTSEGLHLTRAQMALLAADRLDPTHCAYLVQLPLILDGPFDAAAWRLAFEQLAQTHESLRMHAVFDQDRWRAWAEPQLSPGWWQCSDLPIEQAPDDLKWPSALLAHINRPLNVELSGCMRVDVWPVETGETLLVWTVHHAVIDEAAVELALSQLGRSLSGQAMTAPDDSGGHLAELEEAWTDRHALMAFAQTYADAMRGLHPPLARAPAQGREQRMSLPDGLGAQLRAWCVGAGVSLFPLLMCAQGRALQSVFGAAGRFLSTPYSRRLTPALQTQLNYWIDVRMMDAGALPGESWREHLDRVCRAAISAQVRSFQPLDEIAVALSTVAPNAARMLTQFGLTWRVAPTRRLTLGHHQAHLIRAPQIAARYALCLHVADLGAELDCSVEAVDQAFDQGLADAFWRQFVHQLQMAVSQPIAPSTSEGYEPETTLSPPQKEAVRQTWAAWLKLEPASVNSSDHFLRHGGSSLAAMRMVAQLQRDHGISVDLAAFLSRPTFSRLSFLCHPSAAVEPVAPGPLPGVLSVGADTASKVMFLIPGLGGHALGLLRLAQELSARLAPDVQVLVFDLENLLVDVQDGALLPGLLARMTQEVLRRHAQTCVGLAGFSLGGLLALLLARQMPLLSRVPVVLIDAYAPRVASSTLLRRLERRVAGLRLRLAPGQRTGEGTGLQEAEAVHEEAKPSAKLSPHAWRHIENELSKAPCLAPDAAVTLIRATATEHLARLVWRKSSNGFVPAHFRSWSLHEVQAKHLDLPRGHAGVTADLVVRAIHLLK